MKKLISRSTLLSVMVAFSVTVIAQTEAGIKQRVEKMNKEMADAMIAGDHEKSLAFYTNDVISLPSYDKMKVGKAEIKSDMDEMMKSGWKVKSCTFETVSLETNGEIITEIGKYKMEMIKEGMAMPMKDEGKYLARWEKQTDGSLKIKTEIWNSDINPWEEMSAMKKKEGKSMMGETKDKDDLNTKDDKMH